MHLAVLGGSGRMGQELITQALHRNRSVSTLVRRPESLTHITPLRENSLTILTGDATNPNDVIRVICDADAVIHAVSVPLIHHKPTTLYSRTTQAVIDVRSHTKAIHYVVMSSTGTDHVRRELPRGVRQVYEYFLGDVADDKEREESLLEHSSLPYTVIKSPFLIPGTIKKSSLTAFTSYKSSLRDIISRMTVAHTILDIITHQSHIRQKIVPVHAF